MDFGFNGKGGDNTTKSTSSTATTDSTAVTNLDTGFNSNQVSGNDATDLDKVKTNQTDTTKVNTTSDSTNDSNQQNSNDITKDTTTVDNTTDANNDLVAGSTIELGDNKYTVDSKGNILDKDNNIFKEAKDVKDWLATFDSVSDGSENEISINSIQELVGIDLVDADNKPVTFENTPAGVKAYIEAVNEANRDTHYQEALNTLYQKYPIVNDVLNYYVANGNSLEGFGEVQDRSDITIDDTNEEQHKNIIRTAFKEQGRKGNVEQYIDYLKSSGTLLSVAKEELAGIQENDNQVKQQLAEEAERKETARIEKLENYWNGVKDVIKSKNIAGYQIPDTIIINDNGKRTSATIDDFYNYVYQVDKDGRSAYERKLAKQDPKDRTNDELLRAFLSFTNGDYSSLVNMAVNKDKVKNLKLQSAAKTTSSIKITKPTVAAKTGANIDLGY